MVFHALLRDHGDGLRRVLERERKPGRSGACTGGVGARAFGCAGAVCLLGHDDRGQHGLARVGGRRQWPNAQSRAFKLTVQTCTLQHVVERSTRIAQPMHRPCLLALHLRRREGQLQAEPIRKHPECRIQRLGRNVDLNVLCLRGLDTPHKAEE